MTYLIQILLISLFCNGLFKSADEGMILNPIKESIWRFIVKNELKDWWYWPLIGCPYCMASIWGSIIYWVVNLYVWPASGIKLFAMWPIICVACVFTNGLLYELLEGVKRKNNPEPKA